MEKTCDRAAAMRFGILTISDRSSRGERADTSGPALMDAITASGWQIVKSDIIPDDLDTISKKLIAWVDSGELDVLLTTGGTGFAPRDVTPEATRLVVERLTPGLDEAMRARSLQITPHAMLSRAVSGIRKQTMIVNLPGSPKAALENLQVLLPVLEHATKLLRDDPGAEKSH
jgi:molybdenum cofactor synthesis domain-containing protein